MRIALLTSGGGTTMAAIISACKEGVLQNVIPALVIASKEDAGSIAKARTLGISEKDILVINPKSFETREAFGEKIIAECRARNVEFIGQYGWMVKTPENVIAAFPNMIVNQHPGPLDQGKLDFGGPGMYGMRVHQTRLCFVQKTNREFWTEATSHRVVGEYDKGAIVGRERVPILSDDTTETLQSRVLPVEHAVQIKTLQDFANGTVQEYHREEPLILPGEEVLFEECKENAIKLYPHG